MCGLCGWFGQPDLNQNQRLKRARATEGLMLANASRGTDASGVAIIRPDASQEIFKRAVSSYRIVEEPAFNRVVRDPDASLVLGHTRLGTMGKNTDRNAHPFKEGDIVGAHNGIIWNHWDVERWLKQDRWKKPVAVDSQVIFRALADGSPGGDTYSAMLPLLEGQMALTWWDLRDPTALWAFAHDNPLNMAVAPRVGTMFWSSQYEHLAAVMQASYGADWYSISVPDDTVLRFTFNSKAKLEYELWEVKMPKTTYTGQGYSHGGNWYSGTSTKSKSDPAGGGWGDEDDDEDARATGDDGSVTSLTEFLDSQFPKRVSKEELDKRDAALDIEECDMCHKFIHWDDEGSTWFNEGTGFMLCGICANWYDTEGQHTYKDLEEAVAVMDASGMYAGNLLNNRGKGAVASQLKLLGTKSDKDAASAAN